MIVDFTTPDAPDDELYCRACGYVPTPGERFYAENIRDEITHYYCNPACRDAHAEDEMLALFG